MRGAVADAAAGLSEKRAVGVAGRPKKQLFPEPRKSLPVPAGPLRNGVDAQQRSLEYGAAVSRDGAGGFVTRLGVL